MGWVEVSRELLAGQHRRSSAAQVAEAARGCAAKGTCTDRQAPLARFVVTSGSQPDPVKQCAATVQIKTETKKEAACVHRMKHSSSSSASSMPLSRLTRPAQACTWCMPAL